MASVHVDVGSDVTGQNVEKTEFRNYEDSIHQNRVSQFYHNNRRNQTLEFVLKQKEYICNLQRTEMTIWEAAELLNELVDESDPDTDNSQIVHLLQTAEAIRKDYPGEEYDWLHLTGFIHDLGKILSLPKLHNEPQWAVVGDTFPVGCQFEDTNVFHQFFTENLDSQNPLLSSKYGIYHEGIGLDNVHFSFGHDEYMYQVCKQNRCLLPTQALYIIRYHSFYPWHTHGSYSHLCNDTDKEMLQWVKLFQKYDLYSKLPEQPSVEKLYPYYQSLIDKYIPGKLRW